ncbi:MAG: hypothetical protein QHJ73_04240, partial [Armatimonadota bacterium]|nr:hypothetical protein [Armatimonadota bacterium]
LAGRTDYFLSALDDTPRTYGPIRMAGRFGFVSLDGEGRVCRACLVEGTELTCQGHAVKLEAARVTRKVTEREGSQLTLDAPLPGGASLVGRTFLTGETGFEIAAVEGKTLRVRDYPFVGGEEITLPSVGYLDGRGAYGQPGTK